jgi:hypothetical protein
LEFGLTTPNSTSGTSSGPFVKVKTSIEKSKAFGSYNIELGAVFVTFDAKGEKISKVKKDLSGSSMTNYQKATESAVQAMKKRIGQDSVLAYLGV